jgi:hypothetical protein
MNSRKPLRCVTPENRVWTLKKYQNNCDHFGVRGTSLGKRLLLPQLSRFGENDGANEEAIQLTHVSKTMDSNWRFKNAVLTPKGISGTVSNLQKPPTENNVDSVTKNSHLERTKIANRRTFYDNQGRGVISHSAKQKTYLKMVLSRSPCKESKDKNFDEDYINLDNELLSRYLNEECESEHPSFMPRKLRSAVKSSRCRLQMKYDDTVSNRQFVKYGR